MKFRVSIAFAERLIWSLERLRGTRRLAVAAGLGALAALAFEPFRLFPLLLISYAALVLLLDAASASPRRRRVAFGIGWAYGFGFFLVGLHWIGYSFLVDAETHGWELPFAAILLPSGLGLFFGTATLICITQWRPGVQRIFLFAFVFASIEWLRGHILTGFPWNLPAYGWNASLAVLQSASVFGAYGLSLLTLLLGASLAALAREEPPKARMLPAAMTIFFLALWADGEVRLGTATDSTVPDVHLRIVQPDTSQSEKFGQQYLDRNWRRLIVLSQMPSTVKPTHIIWPEAAPFPYVWLSARPAGSATEGALPVVLARTREALNEIATLTGNSTVLFTGEVRIDQRGPRTRFYNSFAMFGPHGDLLATSDKFHLVPFGEYLPFEDALRSIGLTEIAANTGFSSGEGPKTFSVPGAPPVGPLICYEVIFPQAVTGEPRPAWLINMTDDSWFGPNAGPMQHFLIARVRAIEEGLPIVRAANSGISAIIDGYGRVRARFDLGLRGVLDGDLPVALPATPYARFGSLITLALFLLCAGAALWPLSISKS